MRAEIRTAAALFGTVALLTASCARSTESPSDTTATSPSGTTTTASPQSAEAAVATPMLASVLAAPIPVPATDGKVHLAYELLLTNPLAQDVTLTSLTVLAGDQKLLTLSGDRIAYWTRIIGNPTPTAKLSPGQTGMVWLDVALDEEATIPGELMHAIGISMAEPLPGVFPATMTETVAPVSVSTNKPVVISPPLAGPNWLDGNSCCDMTPHRMAMNPFDGRLWASERFAIDYVQLGPDRRLFTGDVSKPESYPYFGADIHAVADGPVVAAVDGLPEQVAGKSPAGLPIDQYGGNHIVQDIGGGNYALYAHLKTGSVKVKPGDRLTTGQVIGLLGNTGNTDAPHLHFHVMSTPEPLAANGLPFVFSSFRVDSRLESLDDQLLDGQPARLQPEFVARDETDVSPLVFDVMTYATP